MKHQPHYSEIINFVKSHLSISLGVWKSDVWSLPLQLLQKSALHSFPVSHSKIASKCIIPSSASVYVRALLQNIGLLSSLLLMSMDRVYFSNKRINRIRYPCYFSFRTLRGIIFNSLLFNQNSVFFKCLNIIIFLLGARTILTYIKGLRQLIFAIIWSAMKEKQTKTKKIPKNPTKKPLSSDWKHKNSMIFFFFSVKRFPFTGISLIYFQSK